MAFQPFMDVQDMAATKSSVPVTDLSAHVDGGQHSARGTNAAASTNDNTVAHIACGFVLVALLLLWFMGALVFRTARL